MLVLPFPAIDPIAFELGPIVVRWYGLAYVAGLLGGWRYSRWIARWSPSKLVPNDLDDLLVWVTLGVVLGGRAGYVLFYKPAFFIENPLEIPLLWHGGMSFHGGLLGVVVAMLLFARRRRVSVWAVTDIVACATPIGLFFGRLANFINGELYGRASDVPWAMVFPDGGTESRHPSQLYEAGLEGVVLFLVLLLCVRGGGLNRPAFLSGVFLIGYAIARMLVELFREPDAHIGFLAWGVTMGQMLSLPMAIAGLHLIWRAPRHTTAT